jgi:hypothetical protein
MWNILVSAMEAKMHDIFNNCQKGPQPLHTTLIKMGYAAIPICPPLLPPISPLLAIRASLMIHQTPVMLLLH